MKKLLLLLLVLPFTNVYAIGTYYSDYRDYKLGTTEVIDLDDTLKKEEYKVYNTVITNIEDQGYVDESVCVNKYPNDTKTTYSVRYANSYKYKWYTSVVIPEGNITKVIVYITNPVNVKEMVIYDKGQKVNAYLSPTDDTINQLMDNNLDTYMRLATGTNIQIMIPKMSSKDFSIEFFASDKVKGQLIFYYEDGTRESRYIYSDIVDVVNQDYYDELKSTVGVDSNGNLNSYEKIEKTLYHCYKKEDIITNIYKESASAENERIIEDDYKILYNYYIRDKVKISDKKITSAKTTLKELVTYSTIDLDNLIIDGVVDYTKNGTYPVKFVFKDDFIVEKDVVINIAKNDKVVEPTTTKSTNTTTKTTTTKKITTSTSSKTTTTVTTTSTSTNKTTTKVKTTKKTIRPNDTCPTYNKYEDEEVLEVEPLKGHIEEKQEKKNNKKIIFKIILLAITIIIVIIYAIYRILESKKETC